MSMPLEPYSGVATIGTTEYSLPGAGTTLQTITNAPGNYELWLDLANLTSTEAYDLKVYEAVRSGGTKRLVDTVRISGAQAEPVYVYPRVALRNGWDITLTRVAGTDRSIQWSIRNVLDSDTATILAQTAAAAIRAALGLAAANLDTQLAGVTAPSASTVAAAVWAAAARTLTADTAGTTTLLSRITGAVLLASSYVAPDNAGIAAIKARTDNLPVDPADASDIAAAFSAVPSATANASAVWAAGTRTLTSASGPDAATIAVAVVNQALAGHTAAGTVGGALQAAGAAGDPWAVTLPGSYADGTAGKIFGRFNVGTPDQPLTPVPSEPAATGLCRVYGYLQTPRGLPLANAQINFELVGGDLALAGTRLVGARRFVVVTNADGAITNGTDPWIDLIRTDALEPTGAYYEVRCIDLGITDPELITLTADMADLRVLLLAV